jgi:hypothetical protein
LNVHRSPSDDVIPHSGTVVSQRHTTLAHTDDVDLSILATPDPGFLQGVAKRVDVGGFNEVVFNALRNVSLVIVIRKVFASPALRSPYSDHEFKKHAVGLSLLILIRTITALIRCGLEHNHPIPVIAGQDCDLVIGTGVVCLLLNELFLVHRNPGVVPI